MSKKYSLKIFNNNKYAMIINSYSVYDGENNSIASGTNLNVNANSSVVLGTQTLADDVVCYWGGSNVRYTSVGAPIEVSDTLTRTDYKLYTLSSTSTTTTYGLNVFNIALSIFFTNITTSGIRNFEISNTSDFAVKKAFSITLSGTSQNYSTTLTQSDFSGILSSGISNTLYLRDITNTEIPINFTTTNTIIYHKLLSPTVSGVDTGVIYEYTVHNQDSYACEVWASVDINNPNNFVNKGTISANGNLTFTSNSNAVYILLKGDYFRNSDVVPYAISYYNLILHQLRVSTTGEHGTYNITSFTSYTKQYNTLDELNENGFDDWLAQSIYSSDYLVNLDSSSIFLYAGANYYMDIDIYTNGVVPSTTSIPVNVVMEDDGEGGYRAKVYITNNSTYNLSGTMSDFTIHDLAQSGAQTISALNVNSTVNLYGTVSHTTTESGERWNLTLNLTDGITNWTLNYEGYLA